MMCISVNYIHISSKQIERAALLLLFLTYLLINLFAALETLWHNFGVVQKLPLKFPLPVKQGELRPPLSAGDTPTC